MSPEVASESGPFPSRAVMACAMVTAPGLAAGGGLGVYPVAAPPAALEGGHDVGAAPVEVGGASAASPAAKGPGNVRPRLAARRRMPAAALGLKKYLDR
jgi:hypothetical protein